MKNIKRSRLWALIPIVVFGAGATWLLFEQSALSTANVSGGAIQRVESWWYDLKMHARAERSFAPVTVAAIDDASIERFGRWPWSRGVFAEMVQEFSEAGARAVAFDIVFSEPEYKSRELERTLEVLVPGRESSLRQILKLKPTQVTELTTILPEIGDQYLGQAIWEHADQTVLGYFWRPSHECRVMNDDSLSADAIRALGYLPRDTWLSHVELILKHGYRLASHEDFKHHDFSNNGIGPLQFCPTINRGAVGSLAQRQGFFNAVPDADGVFRRSHLLLPFMLSEGAREGLYVFPSLTLATAMAAVGADTIAPEWANYPKLELSSLMMVGDGKSWPIPLGKDGSLAIDFAKRGGGQTLVPTVSLARAGAWSDAEKALLKDKIVMIGPTSTGVFDLRPNPIESQGAGVYLHALALSQVLESLQSPASYHGLRVIPLGAQVLVLWGFLGALALSVLFLRRALLASVWWPAILVLALLDVLLFKQAWISSFALIALSWVLTLSTLTLVLYFLEERDRIYLKQAFARYVSPEIVKQIEENPKALNLYGERRQISVLFSDIRKFSLASESMEPDALRTLLSDYFRPMTEIVQRERGTVDKFIGDALMALFGAPVSLPEHPLAAVRAAAEMLVAVDKLRSSDARFGDINLQIGIGVATGLASVGNMGTEQMVTYTALGDVVNLASRLESLTKTYGTPVLISAATHAELGQVERLKWHRLDVVRVLGRTQAESIYGFCAGETQRERYASAYELYRVGRIAEAQVAFAALGKDDSVSLSMARRCELVLDQGVPPDWDGVWNFDHK